MHAVVCRPATVKQCSPASTTIVRKGDCAALLPEAREFGFPELQLNRSEDLTVGCACRGTQDSARGEGLVLGAVGFKAKPWTYDPGDTGLHQIAPGESRPAVDGRLAGGTTYHVGWPWRLMSLILFYFGQNFVRRRSEVGRSDRSGFITSGGGSCRRTAPREAGIAGVQRRAARQTADIRLEPSRTISPLHPVSVNAKRRRRTESWSPIVPAGRRRPRA